MFDSHFKLEGPDVTLLITDLQPRTYCVVLVGYLIFDDLWALSNYRASREYLCPLPEPFSIVELTGFDSDPSLSLSWESSYIQ